MRITNSKLNALAVSFGFLTASVTAHAGQSVTGADYIEIHYSDAGTWNWSTPRKGFLARTSTSGTWKDWTYPGSPYQTIFIDYSDSASSYSYRGTSSGSSYTVTSQTQSVSGTTYEAVAEIDAGDLEITKTEQWDKAGQALLVEVEITNVGTDTLTNFEFNFGVDPDQDAPSDYNTFNSVVDTDTDGYEDQIIARGPLSSWTAIFRPCDPDRVEMGFGPFASSSAFSFDPASTVKNDRIMWLRQGESTLIAGQTIYISFIVAFGSTQANAQSEVASWLSTYCPCDADGDGVDKITCTGGTDCRDDDPDVYPGADEYCNDFDDDCDSIIDENPVDGAAWYADDDADGYGDPGDMQDSCEKPANYVANDQDCDDTDSAVNPDADEYCDGYDNDCDGATDESDAVDAITVFDDTDGDGFGDPTTGQRQCYTSSGLVEDNTDCDDTDSTVYPGATEIAYDGIDQDCDGDDLCDVDEDGFLYTTCGGTDCDDNDANINITATETWYDGIDQDCDGWSDYDQDYDGEDSDAHGGADCDDTDPNISPGATEIWYDGIDQNCDGWSDYDADYDGYDSIDYDGTDCDDTLSDVYPGAPELSDGIDNDCNGYAEDTDADGDGLNDEDEIAIGSDPENPDTDGDGVMDGDEMTDIDTDTDGDGTVDALDTDDDGDGLPTADEIGSYDWTTGTGAPDDNDGDGTPNHLDTDSDDDGYLDETEGLVDTDEDGLPDYLDDDSDSDGILDIDELDQDTDGDGLHNRVDWDDDGDNIFTDDEGLDDLDEDGIPNYLDDDSDGDGETDVEEGMGDMDCDEIPNALDTDDQDGPCAVPDVYFQAGKCSSLPISSLPITGMTLGLFVLFGRRRKPIFNVNRIGGAR